jgi:hypothetical protein
MAKRSLAAGTLELYRSYVRLYGTPWGDFLML